MIRNYREIAFIFAVTVLTLSGCLNLKIPSKIIRTTDNTVIKKANSFFPIESFVIMSQEFLLTTSCGDETSCEQVILNTFSSAGSGRYSKEWRRFRLRSDGGSHMRTSKI